MTPTAATTPDITVTVKLNATLRRYAPDGADPRGFPVTLAAGATLRALAETLEIAEGQWKLAFRNNVHCGATDTLHDGELIAFFPPIAGG